MFDFLNLCFFQCFEGIPPAYQRVKRVVVPAALRVLRLRPGRKYTVLGDLAKRVGWKYEGIVSQLEAKRVAKNPAFHAQQKADATARKQAIAEVHKMENIKKLLPTIQAFEY